MLRNGRSIRLFYLMHFLQGMCFYAPVATLYRRAAGLSGCDSAYLFSCAGEKDSQKVFAHWEAWQTSGLLIAAAVSSLFLREDYRMAGLFTVFSYGGAALTALCLKAPEGVSPPPSRPKAQLRRALRGSLKLTPFLLGAGLLIETVQFVGVFLSQLQYQRAGIATQWFGLIFAAVTLVTLVTLLGAKSHRFTEALGVRRGGGALFACAGAACLAMALMPTPVIAVVGVAVLKASGALFWPLSLTIQNRVADPNLGRATQLSCNAMVLDVVGIVLSPLFGAAADHSARQALLLGGAACAVGLALFLTGTGRTAYRSRDSG